MGQVESSDVTRWVVTDSCAGLGSIVVSFVVWVVVLVVVLVRCLVGAGSLRAPTH